MEGSMTNKNRTITTISTGAGQHWVGDGFPVTSMFSYGRDRDISPFLLLDYAGPAEFAPANRPRGVEQHPHRGFETVTIVYQGEVDHKDTAGNAGTIGSGDVQWMTAASGILHEEMHGANFTRNGGIFEVVQLWVNLPAKDKMAAPGYQEILSKDIPVVQLPDDAGHIRVIAGEFGGNKGAAKSFTPVYLFDGKLNAGKTAYIPLPEGFNASLLLLRGEVDIDGREVEDGEIAFFARDGEGISITAKNDAKFLLMAGEPINEPIAGYGPFVMNTEDEIRQAINDFRAGKFN
jgi:redox-sensitive bicupin YhaK (pirin superfamily)